MTDLHEKAEALASECLVICTGLAYEPDNPSWVETAPGVLHKAWVQLRALSTALREAEAENARLQDLMRDAYCVGVYDQQNSGENLNPAKSWPMARAAIIGGDND